MYFFHCVISKCIYKLVAKASFSLNYCFSTNLPWWLEITDELRMAVKEVICENEEERPEYEAALVAITVDESLKR